MPHTDDSELRELQARAYGRDADIQLDPVAAARLRELEERRRRRATEPEPVSEPEPVPVPEQALQPEPVPAPVPAAPRRRIHPGILIGAVAVVAIAVFVGGVLLGRSGQLAPAPAGAAQLTRLSVDTGYKLPAAFGSGEFTDRVQGFKELRGLRVIVGDGAFFGGGASGEPCLMVYPSAAITDPDSNEFTGNIWSGCQAGVFPATAQLDLKTNVPKAVTRAFPDMKALQFVYDAKHHQVIVRTAH